jgi:hypothetical protein
MPNKEKIQFLVFHKKRVADNYYSILILKNKSMLQRKDLDKLC